MEKQKEYKAGNINQNYKKECEMAKYKPQKWINKNIDTILWIIGIVIILLLVLRAFRII